MWYKVFNLTILEINYCKLSRKQHTAALLHHLKYLSADAFSFYIQIISLDLLALFW